MICRNRLDKPGFADAFLTLVKNARCLVLFVFCSVIPWAVYANGTADHTKFASLNQDFDAPQQVNAACIECHTNAAEQVHKTLHWNWAFPSPDQPDSGKLETINAYHGSIASNVQYCDNCHIGFGLEENAVARGVAPGQVDCLMCHDTTGQYFYTKLHSNGVKCQVCHDDGGKRARAEKKKRGARATLDLKTIAQQVGATSRESCSACHFHDGGADGAKHGDLDASLLSASRDLDVHMSPDGANLSCSSCHQAKGHQLMGSRYAAQSPVDHASVNALGGSRATCVSCHSDSAHADRRLNQHTDIVACQTCHIPRYARGGIATKTAWDWSAAGRKEKGRSIVEYDDKGNVTYASQKGDMRYGENLRPVYRWFNGNIDYMKPGQKIDPDASVMMTEISGAADDAVVKISPFHLFESRFPYDAKNEILVPLSLAGRDNSAFWKGYDWQQSLAAGAEALGLNFSGEVGFVDTQTLWPLNHMVAPAEQALQCASCHENGLLANVEGVYIPGQSRFPWLDRGGMILLLVTALGVLAHGLLRFIFARRRGEGNG